MFDQRRLTLSRYWKTFSNTLNMHLFVVQLSNLVWPFLLSWAAPLDCFHMTPTHPRRTALFCMCQSHGGSTLTYLRALCSLIASRGQNNMQFEQVHETTCHVEPYCRKSGFLFKCHLRSLRSRSPLLYIVNIQCISKELGCIPKSGVCWLMEPVTHCATMQHSTQLFIVRFSYTRSMSESFGC